MDLLFNMTAEESCRVSIEDITGVSDTGYLAEDSTATVKGRFKITDTVALDLLQHNKTTGPLLQTPVYTVRTDGTELSASIPAEFDGWFTVLHIVLPSDKWFQTEKDKVSGSALDLYSTVYYTDGENIYKYINGESSIVTIDEIVERNPDDTTISKVCENYVSICFLQKCWLSLAQQILSLGFTSCSNKNGTDADLIFRRDYIRMALDVIGYMVELNQLAEAERIIEQIGGCNGLCKTEFRGMPSHRCGCGK